MDLRTLLSILIRRWVVVVPVMVLSLLVGMQMVSNVKVHYEATGSITLVPADGNPLTSDTRELAGAANIISRRVNGPDTRGNMVDEGFVSSYNIEVEEGSAIMNVFADADTPEEAVNTVKALFRAVASELEGYQTLYFVAEDERIRSVILEDSAGAQELNAGKARTKVAMVVLGIAATISAALLVESWSESKPRRDRRMRARHRDADVDEPEPRSNGAGAEPRVPVRAVSEGDRSGRAS